MLKERASAEIMIIIKHIHFWQASAAVITIYNSVARMCLDRKLDRKRKTKEQK